MSLTVGKPRDTSLGGESCLADVCLGLGGKGFMVVLGIAVYSFKNASAEKFSDLDFFSEHLFLKLLYVLFFFFYYYFFLYI